MGQFQALNAPSSEENAECPSQYRLAEVIKLGEEELGVTRAKGMPALKREYQRSFPDTGHLELSAKQEAFILSAMLVERAWSEFCESRFSSPEAMPSDPLLRQRWMIKTLVAPDNREQFAQALVEASAVGGPAGLLSLSKFLEPVRWWGELESCERTQDIHRRAIKLYRKNTGLLGFRRDIVQERAPIESIAKGFDTADKRFSLMLGLLMESADSERFSELVRAQLCDFRALAHVATPVETAISKTYKIARGKALADPEVKFDTSHLDHVFSQLQRPGIPAIYSPGGHESIGCSALYADGAMPASLLIEHDTRSVFDEYFEWYYHCAEAMREPDVLA